MINPMGTAIVTGASRGIGRASALALAAAGYDVVVTARTEEVHDVQALLGGKSAVVVGDVSDPAHAADVVAAAEKIGPVELLVNNAGTAAGVAPLWESDAEVWWRVVTINLRGPALMSAATIPGMIAAGRGRIVNVNSLGGAHAFPGHSAYSVSKAALSRLTDCLAAELADTGVLVFDLSPGLVHTALADAGGVFDDVPEEDWTPMETAVGALLALAGGQYDALNGRFVHAEDDLDDLLIRAAVHEDCRRMRLIPAGNEDPLFL
jgi:3-oxoacyl-[acyl-carrier protein] reductase